MKINNINVEKVEAFTEEVKQDLTKAKKSKKIVVILFSFFFLSSCQKTLQEQETISEVVQVIPENGALNVSTRSYIELYFNMPMDRMSCEENFKLYCDSLEMTGTFAWNSNNSHMIFHPDSLCPNMEHTISLSQDAMCDMNMHHQNNWGEHRNMAVDFISKFHTE